MFTKFRVFPISTSVDITVYLYGKNVLYFFYNIAQKNTKILQWMSGMKFSVFTSSYINTALNQSAIRIYKCYIIMCNNNNSNKYKAAYIDFDSAMFDHFFYGSWVSLNSGIVKRS